MLHWCRGGAPQVVRAGAGGTEGEMVRYDNVTHPVGVSLSKFRRQWRTGKTGVAAVHRVMKNWTWISNWTTTTAQVALRPRVHLPTQAGPTGDVGSIPNGNDDFIWKFLCIFQGDNIKNVSNNSQFLHLLPEIKRLMSEGFYPFWQFQTPWTQK